MNTEASHSKSAFKAAQYVRMSTEHQQYSTQNQADKIQEYADKRGIEIVKTSADEGKSGLSIGGRAALQRLISDVEAGVAEFNVILVYDVSRWGRFQDADESAYYEYICRRAGIQVAYCAEQFENDGAQCIQGLDPHQAWWIEDESRSIGRIWLQHGFFDRKKEAPLIIAQRSRENRLDHLVALYGQASREDLAAVFPKIAKRLGLQNAQWAMDAVYAGDLRSAADLALQYYDRTYSESMAKRQDYILAQVDATDCTFAEAAEKILRETQTTLQTWIQRRAQP